MRIFDSIVKWITVTRNLVFLSLLILLMIIPVLLIPFGFDLYGNEVSVGDYILTFLVYANIGAVFAASWDLTAGVTGQFSFGQALFFGLAGYVSGYLNLYFRLPPVLTILAGGCFGVLVGVVVALPSLMLKGPYFMIVSLIFPGILASIVGMYPEVFGESGLYGLSNISSYHVVTYYAAVFIMLLSIFVLLRILSSRLGIIFRSIRDDEDVAEATGINTTKYKLLAWGISGFFAGISGGFQAHMLMTINLANFAVFASFSAIVFAMLGGIGTIIGSVMGSYLLTTLNEVLRDLRELRSLVYAGTLIIVTLYIPFGIYRWLAMRYNIQIGAWNGLKELRRKKLDASNP